MDKEQLAKIRENEKISHTEIYTSHAIYEEGSWLSKPIKTVKDILPIFCDYKKLSVLDLGCGVGRNAIYIADTFKNIACTIDCVDILPLAIEKLSMLEEIFDGWEVVKKAIVEQRYDTPRKDMISSMKTNVVTFVARKGY